MKMYTEKMMRENIGQFISDYTFYLDDVFEDELNEIIDEWYSAGCIDNPAGFILCIFELLEEYDEDFVFSDELWERLENDEDFYDEVAKLLENSKENINIDCLYDWQKWCEYANALGLRDDYNSCWNGGAEYHECEHFNNIYMCGCRFSNEGFCGDFELSGSGIIERHHAHNIFKITMDENCFMIHDNKQRVFYFEAEEYNPCFEENEKYFWYNGNCTVPMNEVFDGVAGYGQLSSLEFNNDEEN